MISWLLLTLACLPVQDEALASGEKASTGFPGTAIHRTPRVEIHWNRYYDYPEIYELLDSLLAEWPELVSMEVIGHSVENREMRVYTIHNPAKGKAESKPAMWVDANVHGNEVQGAEACVYLAWYLLENYKHNEAITELVDRSVFYILPMQNPDGRANWFNSAHSAHSSRTGYQPTDNDRDGTADEDPADDLNGDGNITMMRKYVPGEGTHRLDPDDPRIMLPVAANDEGRKGDWIILGQEGIDNDGDGRVNEDGKGGYDMNRAWPAMWMPEHVQYGAGPYPLYWPETRCIARYLYNHPNVAALQSFHNAGGMILRGPGAEAFGSYDRRDLRTYDELGADGEKMLPFYRYMIIWKDLYSVFGGFATFGYESLGIISFTNELWSNDRLYPDSPNLARGQGRQWFDDNLLMGEAFVDWAPAPEPHPIYGEIEIGGFKKEFGRVPPTFLIEEMLHRNALFCIKHASAMPLVTLEKFEVSDLGGGLKAVDVTFRNNRLIPTRTALASDRKVGTPDVYELKGSGIEVLAGGFRTDRWHPERIELADHGQLLLGGRREPARLLREEGIAGRAELTVRWFVRGSGNVTVTWSGEKAADVNSVQTIPQ